MPITSSVKDLNPKLTQSMHTRTSSEECYQMEMKSTYSQTDKPVERAERRPDLAASIRSHTESSTMENSNLEQDNAFKKDKRSSL